MTDQPSKSLGTLLKERRQELNLSLKEAETATSIQTSQLQALENGDMSKLISPVYAKGFVKQYAAYLGVDGESLVKEYRELFPKAARMEFSYGIGTMETRNSPASGVKWLPNFLWIAAFSALLIAAWFAAKYFEVL